MVQTPVATFHLGSWKVFRPCFTYVDGEAKGKKRCSVEIERFNKPEFTATAVTVDMDPDQKVVYVDNSKGNHYSPVICIPVRCSEYNAA